MALFGSIFNIFMLLFSLTKLSLCLYEDQIGKFDWKQSYIGKIKIANFDSVKRIIVATEENVLAALSIKSGQIIWRHVLENSVNNSIYLLHVDKEVFTVSGDGNNFLVRGWDLSSGVFLWEWSLYTEKTNAYWIVQQGQLLHIAPVVGSHLEVSEYEIHTGKNRGATQKISTPWVSNLSKCTMAELYFTCISGDDSSGQIYYMYVGSREEPTRVYTKPLSSLIGSTTGEVTLLPFKYIEPAVLLERNSISRLVTLQNDSPSVLPNSLSANTITVPNGERTLLLNTDINRDKQNPLQIRTIEADGNENIVETEYPVTLGIPIPLTGVCRGTACRVLFVTSDDALVLLQLPNGKILWTREEALSNVVGVEFIELPVSELDAAIEREFTSNSGDVLSTLYRRVVSQVRQLSTLLTGTQATSNELVRDKFGLHKLIVVVTKVGKLFALDTLTGEVVWSRMLPQIKPFASLDKSVVLIVEQRSARYPPLLAVCSLLARDLHTGNGIIFTFDPITGYSENGVERLPYKIKQTMLLPYEDTNHLKGLLILSEDNRIFMYPTMTDIMDKYANNLFLYSIDSASSTLQGHALIDYNRQETLTTTTTWNVNFGAAKIVAASARPSIERVHSQGRVLADRSVLYKYVNPNLIALATLAEDSLHKHVLSIYLIDGVTGLVVHSTNHKRCKGPVHLVHSENWVVYSYFSERFRRVEMAAIELYEGASQSNSTAFSSHSVSQLPHVETLAYILPANPITMVATLTERGITSKHLLVALSNGAVTEVPWMFLEPRGPHIFSGPDEGSIPYMPELPLVSEAAINYNQSLARVRGIHVSPARLESTSLVLVYGLDLFYSRVMPSKTFDVLKEDFDHWLIVMVLVGLIVSSYITKQLASKKALRQAWK